MRLPAILLLVPLLAAPVAAFAGDAHDPIAVVQHIFETADSDGDGSLTRAEYEGAGLQRFGVSFEESDIDGDGATSLDEYLRIYQRYHPPADSREA